MGGAMILIVFCVATLLIPRVRESLLSFALSRARAALPGQLDIGRMSWPSPGSVRFTDVMWTDGADTLLVAAEIACSVALRPLMSHDLTVDDFLARDLTVDIPAIARRFPPGDKTDGDTDKKGGGFLRGGSLPALPSIAIDRMSVTAPRVQLSVSNSINGLVLEAGCDFREGRTPAIRIGRFAARGPDGTWSVDSFAVNVDLANGRAQGEGRGYVSPGQPWFLSVSSSASDSVSIVIAGSDALEPPATAGLNVHAMIERREFTVDSIQVDATIRIPGAAELANLPGLAARAKQLPEFDGATLTARGTVQLRPRFLARFVCDLGEALWIKSGRFQIAYDHNAFSFDDVALEFLDMPIDRLRLQGRFPLEAGEPVSARIVAERSDLSAGIAASVELKPDIDVQLSPIALATSRLDPAQLTLPDHPSRIRFSPATGVLVAENVRIEGAAGNIRVDARFDRTWAGTYDVACRWQQAPEMLFQLLGLSPAGSDSLRARWRRGDRFELRASGSVTGGAARATKTSGSFTLPGPETFVGIRPDSTRPRELGPVKGSFVVTTRRAASGTDIELTADLDSTSWIDSSIVRVRHSNETTHIDTVGIAALGLVAGARGVLAKVVFDVSAHVEVFDSSLARRFVPEAPSARLTANAHVSGTRTQPRVEAVFDASVNDSAYRIPQLAGRLWLDERGPKLSLNAPRGVFATHVAFDSAALDYESADGGKAFLPARVSLNARGHDIGISVSSLVDTAGGLTFDVSEFSLDIARRDLRSTKPFSVRRNSHGLSIDGLHLSGSLGEIRVDGTAGKAATRLECDLGILFPPEPASLDLPEHLWPDRLDAQIRARDREIDASATLAGFSLAHGLRTTLRMTLASHADSLRARVVVADSARSILDAAATLPAAVSLYPPSLVIRDGALSADAVIDEYPVAFYFLRGTLEIPREEVARVRGRISIGGTTVAPVGHATARMSFPGWPKLSEHEVGIDVKLGPWDGSPQGDLLQRALGAFRGAPAGNLVAALSLNEGGREVLFGALSHPMTLSLKPVKAATAESATMNAILKAESFPLGNFDPVLPSGLSVVGTCKIDVVAGGAARDPKVDGTIVASGVEVSVADQVRLVTHGKVGISGTASAPDVRGEITIENGVIQIPEEQKHLHPTHGKALLRPDTTVASAPAESLSAQPVEQPASETAGARGGTADIKILIPSKLYVRGRGLDLELAGNLQVQRKHKRPIVVGELRAMHGSLVLLGRSLKLERGTIAFQGGQEIDPALDVALSTRVNQTNIQILVAGTARKPRTILTSEPYLKESDIMSVLLFGTTFNDLNDSQTDHLQSRSTEMMAALGAAELQKNLSGIDVVSYQGSDATKGNSGTFTFGKYLTSDVLVSYVYAIDDPQASSFVSLDYLLKGSLRLNTVYGKRNQTGLGIGWKRDF
jgi:hypothetical protein